MRKKIEELRNREEGFTLVELLAVIVILGIIVAIAIPAIGSVIDRAQSNADEAEQSLVADAARLYVTTQDDNDLEWKEDVLTIKVEDLYDEGYLDDRSTTTSNSDASTSDKLEGTVTVTRIELEVDRKGLYEYVYDTKEVTKAVKSE